MLWTPGKVDRRAALGRVLLYDVTLTGNDRFDIAAIPPSFNHLLLLALLRSTVAATGDNVYGLLNGDSTAANYHRAEHLGGSTHSSAVADNPIICGCPAASSPADYFGIVRIWIPNYTAARYKVMQSLTGERRDATTSYAQHRTVHWENTAAITQLTLQPDGYATDVFLAASRLQLFGVN